MSSAAGISFEEMLGPGHFDLRGDKQELHTYQADFVVAVERPVPKGETS